MTYDIDTILRDARIAMGLNPEAEPAWHADAVCRQLTPDLAIRLRIEQAARDVCAEADDASLSECAAILEAEPVFTDDHCGHIRLPADFMRLCAFRMDDWQRPVRKALPADAPQADMLHSRYAGLRGNPQRPACLLTCREGGLSLEFYGCASRKATIETAIYHPYPSIKDGALTNMPSALYASMISRLASTP